VSAFVRTLASAAKVLKSIFYFKDTTMQEVKNVFDALKRDGHEEAFAPTETDLFIATDLAAGTLEKIELLRQRVEMGTPLWHRNDRADYDGLVGVIRPRAK
jgi:hypothetical protein